MNFVKIEEELSRDGVVLIHSVGGSMRPMLYERENQLLIEKISKPVRVNDVVLFKRDEKYVLHRVVGKKKGYFLIRGDHDFQNEKVLDEQIIGILKGFYKNDRYIDCEQTKSYKLYVVFWRFSFPFRFAFVKAKKLFRRILGR